ncbi:Alpha-D-kanosaminyltransferase (2'-deamino-2'-hydroxyneamine 1-alpha-D-kanosaminyltransferase) (Glycosyltransferase KanE) (Kanamycin biosynthesis protein E), partial [Durusdinium trenchii]
DPQPPGAVVVVDQTPEHDAPTEAILSEWSRDGEIIWDRPKIASQPAAMNRALQLATTPLILFLDDDVEPAPGFVQAHALAHEEDETWIVVGQIIQPWQEPTDIEPPPSKDPLKADFEFPFHSTRPAVIQNVMSGHMSVRVDRALSLGGFDENFKGAAYRFDTEFGRRVMREGGLIRFDPQASLKHLRVARGGTRIQGNHLASASPTHGVGDYYFAMCHGWSLQTTRYMAYRMMREVCTRFHLKHPWYIGVKLIGEIRALLWVPIFRHLAERSDIDFHVLFAQIPEAAQQGDGFGVSFTWDVPLLEGYSFEVLENVANKPSVTEFAGCDTPAIAERLHDFDAVIVNGWVVKTCLQALRACRLRGIPCIVRGEANHLRPRAWWKRLLQRQLVRQFSAFLYIGSANRDFYKSYGVRDEQLFPARYCIENERFLDASLDRSRRTRARQIWAIPDNATTFLYCGKFIEKKHPLELLRAFAEVTNDESNIHLLMVGDGELRPEAEALVSNLRLPVTFTGFLNQSEIVDAYLASDCLVLPSDHGETWGLVVNEAMACGLPAIVSDQAGCSRDLIAEGVTGFTFSFGDWPQLVDRMKRAATVPHHLVEMGRNAQEQIREYSPAAAADGFVNAAHSVSQQSLHMDILYFAVITGSCIIAATNWRWGLYAGILVDVLRDPARKLSDDQSVLYTFAGAAVWGIVIARALVEAQPELLNLFRRYPRLRTATTCISLAIIPAGLLSILLYDRGYVLATIGAVSYIVPLLAIAVGFVFARTLAATYHVLAFYAIVNAVTLVSVPLEYFDAPVPGLGGINFDWIRYQGTTTVDLIAGWYRSPDIMGLHAAHVMMFAAMLAVRARGMTRFSWTTVFFWAGVCLLLSGRRKMIGIPLVFLAASLFLSLLRGVPYMKRSATILCMLASIGAIAAGLISQGSEAQKYTDYASTIFTESHDRVNTMVIGAAISTLRHAGILGGGLGLATQGRHYANIRTSRAFSGWQEDGLSKILLEFGVPGLILLIVAGCAFISAMHSAIKLVPPRSRVQQLQIGLTSIVLADAASFLISHQQFSGDP